MKRTSDNENKELFDLAVLGGGPGGYVAAIRAAQLGLKIVLLEVDQVGGTCLHRGCIPSKTYLRTAELFHDAKQAGQYGILCFEVAVGERQIRSKNVILATGSRPVDLGLPL